MKNSIIFLKISVFKNNHKQNQKLMDKLGNIFKTHCYTTNRKRIELQYDPVISLLGISPKNMKTLIQIYLSIYLSLCSYPYVYIHVYVCIYISMYVYVYVCTYVYMYKHIYTHTYPYVHCSIIYNNQDMETA